MLKIKKYKCDLNYTVKQHLANFKFSDLTKCDNWHTLH